MRHNIRSHASHGPHTPDRLTRGFEPARISVEAESRESQTSRERGQVERAMLVAVLLPDTKADLGNPLIELAALAESAGTQVVDSMVQKRTSLSPAYALGKGKLRELIERTHDHQADVVIVDNDLTPRQIGGLEREVGRKVIDRSELILDIFALRAKTREAQLQVELAQLEYTAPRLRGMWTHLERIAGAGGATAAGTVGGVGTRGPGERQIEIDRRLVKGRIGHLKRQIQEIARRKRREVKARSDQFTVSLVGYTNSGKSTLMNRLTAAGRFTADQLFATLDTKTVRWELGDGRLALLSDTVGFVRDIPHHLVASFRATLEEAIHADLLLHVVDISSPAAWQQSESVDEVLADLGCDKIPQITLLNKADIADDGSIAEMLIRHRSHVLVTSAVTGQGLGELTTEVVRRLQGETIDVTIRIPHSAGRLLAEIDRVAEVRDRRYPPEGAEFDVRINRAQFMQLRDRHGALSVLKGDVGLLDEHDANEHR